MLGVSALLGVLFLGVGARNAAKDASEEDRLFSGFLSLCEAMHLQVSGVDGQWCVGTVSTPGEEVPVVMRWYTGSPRYPTVKGIAVTMPVGILEGGGWGIELGAGTVRWWGEGEGEEALRKVALPEVLEEGKRIPVGVLMPLDRVSEEDPLRTVVAAQWGSAWKGLGIRSLLGRESRTEQSKFVVLQMAEMRAGLRALERGEPLRDFGIVPAPVRPPPPQN